MAHSAIIDDELNVWTFGWNELGQLGLGDFQDRHLPEKIPNLPPIVSTATGLTCTIFLDHEGCVWICGEYQLIKKNIPEKLVMTVGETAGNIVKISCKSSHLLLLDSIGNVFACGNNNASHPGLNTKIYYNSPARLKDLPSIKDIACGYSHSILLDIDGNCWVFGKNESGQLGLGNTKDKVVPIKIENLPQICSVSADASHTILIDIHGNVYGCGFIPLNTKNYLGYHYMIPTLIQGIPKIKSAACGMNRTIMIDINNELWGLGSNDYGELGFTGDSTVMTPIKLPQQNTGEAHSVLCYGQSTIIINSKGDCFSFGFNRHGRLGLGHMESVVVPTKIEGLKANVSQHRRFGKTKNARN